MTDEESKMKRKLVEAKKRIAPNLLNRAITIRQMYSSRTAYATFADDKLRADTAKLINDLMQAIWDSKGNLRSQDAKHAADKRHEKPGGSRDKQDQIRNIWKSGKYSSQDICAEQECGTLGMSFSTARKALRKTPKPT